jgi:tetratricopeptide (TPR) repeat protein
LEGVVKYIQGVLKSEGPVAGDRERLAIAIAIWGSILRCLEQPGNAAAVFPLALEIAGTARGWTLGVVLQKSSFLLRYCGEVRQALCFCGLAADCFLIHGHLGSFGQTLVDKSIFLFHLGEYEEAQGIAQASLKLLDVSDWRNQVAVHQTLSACAREQDDLLGAQHHLDRALKLFGDRTDSSKAHLCWSMARLLTRADQTESAIHHLEMAFGWMGEFGMPADIGLVALDLGHAYLLSNERGKLQRLTETIMTLGPVLRRHVLVDRVLMEFVRYTVAGEVNLGFIEMAKRKIQGASPGARPVLD